MLDSRDGLLLYEQITPYKRQNGAWNKENVLYIVEESKKENTNGKNQELKINFGGKSLYKAPNSDRLSPDDSAERPLSEAFKESNSGFWIWMENVDTKGFISGLPYPFNVTTNINKKTKTQDCGIQNYFSEARGCSEQDASEWKNMYQQKIKQLDKSSIKGKWVDAEEICEAGNKRKLDIIEEQLNNLRMFCAKPKEES